MKLFILFITALTTVLFSQVNSFEHIYSKNIIGLSAERVPAMYPQCISVDEDYEGNFILINSFGYIIKTNSAGDILWIRKKADIFYTTYFETPVRIKNAPDSTYIVCADNKLLKLDYSGETIWEYLFNDYLIYSFLVSETGEILAATKKINQGWEVVLVNFTAEGDSTWSKSFQIPPSLPPFGQPDLAANDSTIYLSGGKRLYALNLQYEVKWQKEYNLRISDLILSPENIFICFVAAYDVNTFDKLDLNGNSIWTKNISSKRGEYIPQNNKVILLGTNIVHIISGEDVESFSEPFIQNSDAKITNNGLVICGNTRGQMRLLRTDYNYYYKGLTLTYPSGFWNDNYLAGADFYLHYKATNITSPITFEFSTDQGNSWNIVSSDLLPGDTSYIFNVPVLSTDSVLLKLRTDDRISAVRLSSFALGGTYDYINVNNVKMWVSNSGDGSHDPFTDRSGFFWPDTVKTAIFEDGLLFGGILNGEVRVNGNTHRVGLIPGSILYNGLPDDSKKVKYSTLKLKSGWKDMPDGPEKERYQLIHNTWPVEMGAPFRDVDGDGIFNADIDESGIGDETLFYVANDKDTSQSTKVFGSNPVGLEFQTTIFGFNQDNALKDVVYKKYTIINKSGSTIDDMFLSYWADPDLGFLDDDYVGVDSSENLAFCYNSANSDIIYGSPVPAVGHRILQGPIVPAGAADTAFFKGKKITGYRNLNSTSFMVLANSYYWPNFHPPSGVYEGTLQTYNIMQGLNTDGSVILNPITGNKTSFVLNGDPVGLNGWYEGSPEWQNSLNPGDRIYLITSGPFTMTPGDTQEIVIAIAAAIGQNNRQSITELIKTTRIAEYYYKSGFTEVLSVRETNVPLEYFLSQNYPNPFNPSTKINYQIPENGFVTLKIFDILGKEIAVLVNDELKAGIYEADFNAARLASGVYIYQLKVNNFISSKKMLFLK